MALKAGIVGLPNVGKSTLFNAITNSHVLAENYPFATIDPNTGIVQVPDKRLDFLSELYKPKKTIPATCEFYDIAGLVEGASKGEGLGNRFLGAIRECDAIVEVVRCFKNDAVLRYNEAPVDPQTDIDVIGLELAMSDLEAVKNRIGKVEVKARVAKDKVASYELPILRELEKSLTDGIPARLCKALSESQMEYVKKNFFLLTSKPIMYVANVSEADYADLEHAELYKEVKAIAEKEGAQCIPISCQIEYDLTELPDEEKEIFLEELGQTESGLDKLVRATYKLLDLSTFFTSGEDECRAWTFKTGMKAPQCAGVIHTDFEKGFIKAEVYSFDDIYEYKNELAIREAGKLRSEGKEYVMKDGDVVFFKFNV